MAAVTGLPRVLGLPCPVAAGLAEAWLVLGLAAQLAGLIAASVLLMGAGVLLGAFAAAGFINAYLDRLRQG